MIKNFKYLLLFILLFFECTSAVALEQHKRIWSDLTFTGSIHQSKWEGLLEMQARNNLDGLHYLRRDIIAGLGYQFSSAMDLWLGYQRDVTDQSINATVYGNRLWEQANWQIYTRKHFELSTRFRLEERSRAQQPQWNYRYRQRITIKFSEIFHKLTPIITEEIFFNLNQPQWAPNATDQNRVFLGVDILTSKHTYLEVGYLNQYEFRPLENQMNNIIYISLVIQP